MLRAVAGIVDMGELVLATFGDPDGGGVATVADDKSDVWVEGQCATDDVPTGKETSRLFIPMNMLFRLPKAGESYIIARGKDAAGPGKSYALYGDCGAANQVPGWDDGTNLDANNPGIFLPEGMHIESTGDRVRIVANSGGTKSSVELLANGSIVLTPAAGQTVQLGGTAHKAVLDTLLTDFATNWNLLLTVLGAGTQGTPAAQTLTALAGALTALQAFATNMTNGSYESLIVENG